MVTGVGGPEIIVKSALPETRVKLEICRSDEPTLKICTMLVAVWPGHTVLNARFALIAITGPVAAVN